MKKYYIKKGDFANQYRLRYIEPEKGQDFEIPEGYEHITKPEAIAYAKAEKMRRKEEPSFSGYADAAIYPFIYDYERNDIESDSKYKLWGYVWEKLPNGSLTFTFEIIEHICILGRDAEEGYTRELNLVSFNDAPPKRDIRGWNIDHTRMTKGSRYSEEEMQKLLDAFEDREGCEI